MRQFLLIFIGLLIANAGFAETPLDPSTLSWIKNLNQEVPKLIEDYKAEVAAINKEAGQAPLSKQCTGVCKSSEEFEALLKARGDAPLPPQSLQKQVPQLLVFVSFSMDKETLKALAQNLKQVQGALVFRGLVNDSFKDTGKAFQELGEEALIDPTLFRAHQVTVVPTFVLRQAKDEFQDLSSQTLLTFDQIIGNVTLDYVLSQFTEKGEVKGAEKLLRQLRGKE
jgi:type-F conjugative transfer system pilin assembly protein TrbC